MSLLGGIGNFLGGAAKVVGGFAAGGPVGGLLGVASLMGGPKPAQPSIFTNPATPGGLTLGGGFSLPGGIGAAGGIAFGGGYGSTPSAGGGCPRGYHLNKHALPASKRHGAVAARTICVRNRHMNPLNHRADSRALRRLKRADKMTRKIHSLFHHTRRIGGKRK